MHELADLCLVLRCVLQQLRFEALEIRVDGQTISVFAFYTHPFFRVDEMQAVDIEHFAP